MKVKLFGYEFIVRKWKPAREIKKEQEKQKAREQGYRLCHTMLKRMMTREQAVQMRDKTKAPYLRIYMCEFCNTWHLTHKKQYKP